MSLNKEIALLSLLALLSQTPARGQKPFRRMQWLMGTFCSIETSDNTPDAAITAAFEEISRWDHILSLYIKESELNAFNASAGQGPFHASQELFSAVETALKFSQETGGAFDPTVLPIIRKTDNALQLVGWNKVKLYPDKSQLELPLKGMGLDFGGIGKGWALDHAAQVLKDKGINRALLNFGGQILVFDISKNPTPWVITLPNQQTVKLANGSVSTSGDSQHPGHIVSPFTGKALRQIKSATVIMPSATDADAWSTALYVLGNAPPQFKGQVFFISQMPDKK